MFLWFKFSYNFYFFGENSKEKDFIRHARHSLKSNQNLKK